jgi:nicotinamidase-related amidase
MQAGDVLPYGPLNDRTVHLCIDMQNIYAEEDSPWHTPWMKRVLPVVTTIAQQHPQRTIFTRFITADEPEEMPGAWQRYYERWKELTRKRLDPRALELVPPLAELVPPAIVLDKKFYSPFHGTELARFLRERHVDSVVISGAETDMCVLGAVMDAVDLGLRVVLAEDALCSSSDATHDALMTLYRERYAQQIETASADTILACWFTGSSAAVPLRS